MKEIIIGSRGSKLALWQSEWVKARLEALRPGRRRPHRDLQDDGRRETRRAALGHRRAGRVHEGAGGRAARPARGRRRPLAQRPADRHPRRALHHGHARARRPARRARAARGSRRRARLAEESAGGRGRRHVEPAAHRAAQTPAARRSDQRPARQRGHASAQARRGRLRRAHPRVGRAAPARLRRAHQRGHRARRDAARPSVRARSASRRARTTKRRTRSSRASTTRGRAPPCSPSARCCAASAAAVRCPSPRTRRSQAGVSVSTGWSPRSTATQVMRDSSRATPPTAARVGEALAARLLERGAATLLSGVS